MIRRSLICLLGAAFIAGAMPAQAQTPNRVYRLAHIANSELSEAMTRALSLPELAKLGFVEGRNLVFDGRVGAPDALPGLIQELLSSRPDVLIAVGAIAMKFAGAATRSVPIVTFGADPIELGLATSYARPGGNATGVMILASELELKRLSILHEAVPNGRRVGVLVPSTGKMIAEATMRAEAASLGVELQFFTVASADEYPSAFTAMRAAGMQALVIGATPEFYRDGKQLATLALESGLPTICEWAAMAQTGCMIGYGPSRTQLRKRMADQIAQIFRGKSPGEIAIERATVFEFAINQQIAKKLDLSIPISVLARADEVIE